VTSARVLAVVGPTAAGKSTAGLELAERLGGEVVNADAMALYRGMDIGTAKTPVELRRAIPHHLLDVWEITERASVARYQELARRAVADILARGRVAVVVGGSGLYVQSLLDDFQFPGTDPALRAGLEAELAVVGPVQLHERLAALDPDSAARIGTANGRRIVRALEVVTMTGSPFAAKLPDPKSFFPDTVLVGIDPGVAELDERIADRVEAMFAAGLVGEVARLEAMGLRDGVTARQALGYRQVLDDPATALEATVAATRRFARRQRSWFRRDRRINWVRHPDEVFDPGAGVVTRSGPPGPSAR
jgi:tRNA dimethylallyltransferase